MHHYIDLLKYQIIIFKNLHLCEIYYTYNMNSFEYWEEIGFYEFITHQSLNPT